MNVFAGERVIREESRTFLERVRGESCYKTLRSLINLLAACLGVLGLLQIAVAIALIFLIPAAQQQYQEVAHEVRVGSVTFSFLLDLGILLAGLFCLVLAIAGRQAALLLVDIADMMIDRGRQAWRFSGDPNKPA